MPISKDYLMFPNGYILNNCAVNIELDWNASSFYLFGNASGHTGIVNNTKLHSSAIGASLIAEGGKLWDLLAVNEEHWNDAQWLSDRGFYVA